MISKTRGIVLNHTRYGESSAVVHVFTLGLGAQTYMVNGVYGSKRKDKVLLLQPLNLLDMEVYHKQGKEIQRIKEFKLERALMRIPFSQARRAQAFLITEVLSKVLRNENANQPLFTFIEDAIEFLDSDKDGLENFHLFFLFQLTAYLGFYPHNNYSLDLPIFDLMEGCFISAEPDHPHFLNIDNSLLLLRLFNAHQNDHSIISKNLNDRRIILNALISLYELHFSGVGRWRTIDVLGELFKE